MPQGQAERHRRAAAMVKQMDLEHFGGCTLYGECQEACPKEISIDSITRMNRDFLVASLQPEAKEAASGAINLIVLPMAFLSGVFFDVTTMPSWLQSISWAMPMRHLSAGMLDVLVRDGDMTGVLQHLAVLVGFALVLGLVAARCFTWED